MFASSLQQTNLDKLISIMLYYVLLLGYMRKCTSTATEPWLGYRAHRR